LQSLYITLNPTALKKLLNGIAKRILTHGVKVSELPGGKKQSKRI
jgi:hypothetical protein